MAIVGPALTCNGYNSATGKCASTSIPSYVPASEADTYMSGSYGTASTSPQDASTPAAGAWSLPSGIAVLDAITQGIAHPFDTLTGHNTAAMNADISAGKGPISGGTVAGLLGIVTDLPRVGTILVGGLLLAAGLFALAGGNKIIQVSRGA